MNQPHNLKFLGVDIEFPFDPYSIQKCMMSQIIGRLTNKEHGLIESPTGTGKTLVLLCSTLAWQKKSKAEGQPFVSLRRRKRIAEERMENLKKRPCSCDDLKKIKSNGDGDGDGLCPACMALKAEEKFTEIVIEDNEEQLVSSTLRCKVPRIYYGTRTHKQITQVVRELNKTPYKNKLRMCILSSRDRTCINSEVRDLVSRNDKCQELVKNSKGSGGAFKNKKLKGETCPYYSDSSTLNAVFEAINDVYNSEAWDIEDAAKFGRENNACPYFGARSLQSEADITFCPYNYLLDSTIRNTLDINLKDAIVIFDEAHNIEDICRDSASFVIDTNQIHDLAEALKIALSFYQQSSPTFDAFQYFKNKMNDLHNALRAFPFDEKSFSDSSNDYVERHIMTQSEMKTKLRLYGLGPDDLDSVKEHLKRLRGDDDEDVDSKKSKEPPPGLNSLQQQFLTQLKMTLTFMYGDDGKYFNDFRTVITKHLTRSNNSNNGYGNNWRKSTGNNNFQSPRDPLIAHNDSTIEQTEDTYYWKISILCMNPGIAFEKIHNLAWSVFVASGTLAPIESLKTELGCNFSGTFQGSHVINRQRVFGSIISNGPSGTLLNCSYGNSLSLEFQDSVGQIVRDVSKTVPNGVLVFFPSYDRMENLYQRWVTKGFMKEINQCKRLFREQRKLTVDEFESRLEEYNRQAEKKKGAILFAVYRGKVSEGIDFADKAARAVITIGIPYPNIKEVTIGLKKEYNDSARATRPQLMTGSDWYATQAFRALNQALGRCIRHKDDWGAIIMIDSRLNMENNQKNISRWLREALCSTREYSRFYEWLQEFVALRNTEDAAIQENHSKQELNQNLVKNEKIVITKELIQPKPEEPDVEIIEIL